MHVLMNGLAFLVSSVMDLVILLVMLRFVMQVVRANINNSICRTVHKLTQPVLQPLQKVIPVVKGVDLAIVVLLLVLQALEVFLITVLQKNVFPHMIGTFVTSFGLSLKLLVNVYFYGILIQAVLSWINPLHLGTVAEFLYVLTAPVLQPIRRMIPNGTGIDLSPLVVLIGLQLITIVVVGPVLGFGTYLMS